MSARVLCPRQNALACGILEFSKGANQHIVVIEDKVGVARDAAANINRRDEAGADNSRCFAAGLLLRQRVKVIEDCQDMVLAEGGTALSGSCL